MTVEHGLRLSQLLVGLVDLRLGGGDLGLEQLGLLGQLGTLLLLRLGQLLAEPLDGGDAGLGRGLGLGLGVLGVRHGLPFWSVGC